MNLGITLPQALDDELGMYETVKSLRITINACHHKNRKDAEVTLGSYTFGHISLFPCPNCTVGFLTHVYLHELCHAWLHQYHESVYEYYDSCAFSNMFSNEAFNILGGDVKSLNECSTYNILISEALKKLTYFQDYALHLTTLDKQVLIEKINESNHENVKPR